MRTIRKDVDRWNRKIQGMIQQLTPQQLSVIRTTRAEQLRRLQEMAAPDELVARQRNLLRLAEEAFALQSVRP